jgi:hypothetical protein
MNNLPFSSSDRQPGCGGFCPIVYTGGGYCVGGSGGYSPVPGASSILSRPADCEMTYLPNVNDFDGRAPDCVEAELRP